MSGDSLGIGDATPSSVPLEAGRPPLSKDVFVSYASQDAAVANAAVEALESQGIRCWIAPRDVTPGEFYADAIVHAIDAAQALVLVFSEHAAVSHHILREVERASSKRHPVISLRIDRAALPAGLEYFLNTSQWLDASEGEPRRAFPKLVEAVRKVLAGRSIGNSAQSTPAFPTGDPIRDPLRRSLRRTVVAVVGLVAVVICGFAIDRFWWSRRVAAERPAPQASAAVAFAPPPHSIAVLPFVNMSGDASQEYFSDGITEELLNSLSRLNELQVVARTSSFSFKGQNVDVSTIAHKLNVGAILEGSVRRAGNTVRITVQLIDAVTGFRMWSQTYDRQSTDILKVQSEVATTVAQQLRISLSGNETAKIEVGGTANADAYDAYLRATRLRSVAQSEEDYRAAVSVADQAIAHDPNFAAAYALRAEALSLITLYTNNLDTRTEVRTQALVAAERAVSIAPEFGLAHLALARVRAVGLLDFVGAAPEFDRALKLAPGSAKVQGSFAFFAAELDHHDAALQAARRAVSLDPQNYGSYKTLADVQYWGRRFGDAIAALRDAGALRPASPQVNSYLAPALIATGQVQQARQLCESAATPFNDEFRFECLALAYHALGRQADAEHQFNQLQAKFGDSAAYGYATLFAQWGNKPAALKWLSKAERLRAPGLGLLKVDWMLDPIRNEPEFKAILARMNFPP